MTEILMGLFFKPAVSNEGGAPAVDTDFAIAAYPTYCLIGPDNTLLVRDIWPLSGVETFEATFPSGFEPQPAQCTVLGVNDVTFNFNIYPTVSKGNVNIQLQNAIDSQVTVINTLGQQVFTNTYSEKNISLNLQLAGGMYLVKVSADGKTATKRIIIE